MVFEAITLAIAGFIIGIFSGLLGIGGGTVVVPVLRLGYAFEAVAATATSLFTIIFTSIGGTVTHLRNKTCIPKLSLCLGVGGAITSSLGAYLGTISPDWLVMAAAAFIIFYSAFNMLRKAIKLKTKTKQGDACADKSASAAVTSKAPRQQESSYEFTLKRGLGGLCVGLIAGLASGYVGVGGGFIMVPLMTAWLGVPMQKASGTSLIAIMILAIPGTVTQLLLGNVNLVAGVCLAVGSIPGAMLGARFVKRIPERQLRFLFAAFLGIAALSLILNEAGIFG